MLEDSVLDRSDRSEEELRVNASPVVKIYDFTVEKVHEARDPLESKAVENLM